jgi:hypothetical protein
VKWPFVSRAAYDLLTVDVTELKAERRILLDRLAMLGLGGPLYAAPLATGATEDETDKSLSTEPSTEEDVLDELLRLRRRPAKLAEALTRSLRRKQEKRPASSRIAWIAEGDPVNAALDRAEELGRKTASSY